MIEPPRNGVLRAEDGVRRCWWCVGDDMYVAYHDTEWGRPIDDDRLIFEKICLEGFQSGLSWLTILRKRENFRRAFASFDPERVARFGAREVERLLQDAGIVRHRGKIEAVLTNARRYLELVEDVGSLAAYVWSFEPDARRARLDWPTLTGVGADPQAKAMSKDLRKRGWAFVGPTTVYSMMESIGLVNDHMSACDVRADIEREREAFHRPALR